VTPIDPAQLVHDLSRAAAYPSPPREVVLHETPISWVFVTDRYAYKLKKPVRFDFLDYSTSAARRRACDAEVRLNRRMAADVYLGVVSVVCDAAGRLAFEAAGEPVDWAVKMHRLPDDRRLDELIRGGRLSEDDVEQVAERLAAFYRQAAPLVLEPPRYRAAIETHVRANRRELLARQHGLPTALVERVHEAQLQLLALAPDLLDERVCDGRIVDGHGDLRAEHVYLLDAPVVIDCIEFNDEFRQVDAVDELAFLAMECDFLGAGDVGGRVLEVYCRACDDAPPAALVNFFQSYRAAVRAKVHALRADQLPADEQSAALSTAAEYLRLADRYRTANERPLTIVVSGLMGTGKSTLAVALAETLGLSVLATDVVRRELLGASDRPAGFGDEHYSAENRARVYDEMFRRAGESLADGRSIILDGTFLSAEARSHVLQLARRHRAQPFFVRCVCPDEVARQRIAGRAASGEALSEARPELLAAQRAAADEIPPHAPLIEIDTTDSPTGQAEAVLGRLAHEYPIDRSPWTAPLR